MEVVDSNTLWEKFLVYKAKQLGLMNFCSIQKIRQIISLVMVKS